MYNPEKYFFIVLLIRVCKNNLYVLYWDTVLLTKTTDWMFSYKENYKLDAEHKHYFNKWTLFHDVSYFRQ